MKSLSEQQAEIAAELKQLENRQKILLNRKHKEERRERTHRLIEQGAILESVFPEIAAMTGDASRHFCNKNSDTTEERNPSLEYKGALIHPYGCCAVLQTAL